MFEVWKTIKLGTGLKTADDFRKAFKAGGSRISDWANDILDKPAFSAREIETDVDLVVVSTAELGFKDRATREDIYEQALQLGLELCPAEVGPQLRLQYQDQPMNEWLLIAMESITDSGGGIYLFSVGRNYGGLLLMLDGDYGSPSGFWGNGCRWVFVVPHP